MNFFRDLWGYLGIFPDIVREYYVGFLGRSFEGFIFRGFF